MNSLLLAGAYSDKQKAADTAARTGGINLTATATETNHLPFASLVLSVTDELDLFVRDADAGSYLVCERPIKNAPLLQLSLESRPGSIGIFTMVANADLGARESDRHWRDKHAPLALEVHTAMTHYYQLSVLQRFKGPAWNGFALCCFSSEEDLRNKFFNTPDGETAIARDVAIFADPRKSPRRVLSRFARADQ
jgi:hypothetical protein